MIKNLQDLESKLPEFVADSIKNNEPIILDLITEDQLFEKGIDRHGKTLSSRNPYSPVTISIKQAKGQPTARVTLRDSKDFHDSAYIEYDHDAFEIKFSDWKFDELKERYGDIDGLTKENLDEILKNYVLGDLIKAVRNELT